jgi:hypothetical protein
MRATTKCLTTSESRVLVCPEKSTEILYLPHRRNDDHDYTFIYRLYYFDDCFCLLDSRLSQLHPLIVKLDYVRHPRIIINNEVKNYIYISQLCKNRKARKNFFALDGIFLTDWKVLHCWNSGTDMFLIIWVIYSSILSRSLSYYKAYSYFISLRVWFENVSFASYHFFVKMD